MTKRQLGNSDLNITPPLAPGSYTYSFEVTPTGKAPAAVKTMIS